MPRLTPHPSVVCTLVDGGGVLLHLETKYYYSLNASAFRIWTLLEEGESESAILRPPGGSEAAASVDAFLLALERESLVERAPGNGASPTPSSPLPVPGDSGGEWVAPTLRKHDVPLNQILSNPFDPSVPLAE